MQKCTPPDSLVLDSPHGDLIRDPQRFASAIYNAIGQGLVLWPEREYRELRCTIAEVREGAAVDLPTLIGNVDDAAGTLATASNTAGMALGSAIESFRRDLLSLTSEP